MLRRIRVFPDWVYYGAIATNTLCRLGWAILISKDDKVVAQHLTLVLGAVELYRRAQWALLRVEWEQIRRAAEEADEKLGAAPSLADGLRTSLLDPRGGLLEATRARRESKEKMVTDCIRNNRKRMNSVYSLPPRTAP